MKRVSEIAILGITCFAVAGCSKSPGNVATNYIQAAAAGNTDTALQCFSPMDRKEHGDANIKVLLAKIEASIQNKKGIESVTVAKEEIDGATATVSLEIKFADGDRKTEEIPLKMEDGAWYVTGM